MGKMWQILAVLFSGAGVVFLVWLLEYRKNRPRIRVTVSGRYGIISIPEFTKYGAGSKIIITAINVGHRAVTLVNVGLLLPRNRKDQYVIAVDSLKRTRLEQGESKDYIMNEDEVITKYNLTKYNYVAYVLDATNRRYWSHNKLKRLIKLGRIK